MVDVGEKVDYKVEKKSGAEHEIDNTADKVKAAAKAMGKKVRDPDRDLGTEYNVQKAKEKLD
jgi:hypothetical protein